MAEWAEARECRYALEENRPPPETKNKPKQTKQNKSLNNEKTMFFSKTSETHVLLKHSFTRNVKKMKSSLIGNATIGYATRLQGSSSILSMWLEDANDAYSHLWSGLQQSTCQTGVMWVSTLWSKAKMYKILNPQLYQDEKSTSVLFFGKWHFWVKATRNPARLDPARHRRSVRSGAKDCNGAGSLARVAPNSVRVRTLRSSQSRNLVASLLLVAMRGYSVSLS